MGSAFRMTRALIAIVADDLTGAADAGLGFARAGFRTRVIWPDASDDAVVRIPLDAAEVLAIDTGSRAVSRERAVAITTRVVTDIRATGIATLYKKIDSTLRGHVGDELASTLDAWHPWSMAVVAPAFPAMGRTTIDGQQCVGGALLSERSIVRPIERAGLRAAQLDLGRIRSGNLVLSLGDLRDRGIRAVVCDAETDADLDAIAAAGVSLGSRLVWVGSGGLSAALSSHLGSVRPPATRYPDQLPSLSQRPVLTIMGSRASVAREQLRRLIDSGSEHVVSRGSSGVVDEVGRHLEMARDVVVSIEADGAHDGSRRDNPRLAGALASMLRPLADRIGGLILTGGDTAIGVLRAWGVTGLQLVGQVQAGIPVSMTDGDLRLLVVTKAGGFGGPSALAAARDRLRD